MITYLRVQNFKSWTDSREVKLAPLTGFFGTNSAGKSSLLQMLLLLKLTVGRNEALFFGDENSFVNLGNFQEVIHGHQSDSELYFGIKCKLSHSSPNLLSTPFQTIHFAFDTVIRENEGNLITKRFQYTSLSSDTKIVWENNSLFNRDQNLTPILVQNCYGLPSSENSSDVPKALTAFSSAFEELFSHVYYLGPSRVYPKRHYHWAGTHPKELSVSGDKAIDALLSARVRQLKTSNKEDGVPIENRISEWLQKMELAHSFWIGPGSSLDGNDYEMRIQKSSDSVKVPLTNIGYGVTQFLPVLLLCYYVPMGSTLILEEPSTHLHPKAQADIADILIEVITERKLQILVESHSEHLLNRLQRRIAEERISVDKTALYFCRNDEGVSNIQQLEMDEFGNIANWPQNFFGDEMGDLFAMTKAQRERQKRAEG